MEADLRSHLLALADTFSAATGDSLSGLSKKIFNDNTFFARMRAGKNFTARSYDRAVWWFVKHWPEALEWPPEVPKPSSAPAEEAA